jgi:hypothetical protein
MTANILRDGPLIAGADLAPMRQRGAEDACPCNPDRPRVASRRIDLQAIAEELAGIVEAHKRERCG